jgi:hypothetical protein
MQLLLKYTLKSGELIKTGRHPHPPEANGKISFHRNTIPSQIKAKDSAVERSPSCVPSHCRVESSGNE